MDLLTHPDLGARWGATSQWTDLDGPVYHADFGGPGTAEPASEVVLVHGLGGSHLNWVHVGPALARHHRVRALDLPGFGFTRTGLRSATVTANADLLAAWVRQVVGRPVTLVGNSMGGMVSALAAARHPDAVERLVLVNPALPLSRGRADPVVTTSFALYSVPFVGERFLDRLSAMPDEQRVRGSIELCFADLSRADPAAVAAGVEMTTHRRLHVPESSTDFLQAARSIVRLSLVGRAAYRRLLTDLAQPVLLVHGDRDRLVSVAAARRMMRAAPHWRSEVLPGVGHTPMMEVPEQFLAVVQDFLAEAVPPG